MVMVTTISALPAITWSACYLYSPTQYSLDG